MFNLDSFVNVPDTKLLSGFLGIPKWEKRLSIAKAVDSASGLQSGTASG